MAGIPNSPAVVFLERDNSAYPPNVNSSVVGLVGFASKGPTNKATLVTSQENLLRIFGRPSESIIGQGLEGALEILEATDQIQYVRAIGSDAVQASANLQFGVCPAVRFAASGYGISNPLYLTVSVKDGAGVQVLENKQIPVAAGSLASIGQASALAEKIGDGSVKDDHVFVVFDSTTTSTGYLVAPYAGKFAELSVSTYSNTAYSTPTSALVNITLSSSVEAAGVSSAITTNGLDISLTNFKYVVESLYAGAGYNITYDSTTGQTLGVGIEVGTAGGEASEITVNDDGIAAEGFKVSLLNDTTFIETVINTTADNPTSDFIMGEIYTSGGAAGSITKMSTFLSPLSSVYPTELSAGVTITNSGGTTATGAQVKFVKLLNNSYDMSGGSDGAMAASSVIGTSTAKTGIYALDDDLLNISVAAVPGIQDQDVQQALVTVAETSQNFLAVLSPPFGTAYNTVQEVTDWMNGRAAGRTAALNSSWAAVYWPWVQVFDVFSAKDMWFDPVIFAIRQMVATDALAETWFAPAGFRRGRLTKPTATEVALNQGDRDSLYNSNVNPIVNFSPEGITIFGQKTAQRLPTALDRVNVRRLMIYLRKVLLQSGRTSLFEPNDEFTWETVKENSEAILSDIKARRGITDFRVVCDETVNTPVRVDRNELWCKILLKPTKTAEWVIFEVNLTNQSAKFSG
jgi:phage tail sheath protein FI